MEQTLTAKDRYMLQHQDSRTNSFCCPDHGIVQALKSFPTDGTCPHPGCKATAELITDPITYEQSH